MRSVSSAATSSGPLNVFEAGNQWGAEVISEQETDLAKMGSHTSRYASVLAALYDKTKEPALRERAYRSFNWATY